MAFARHTHHAISTSTYLELVRSLLATLAPAVIMGLLFSIIAWTCATLVGGAGMIALAMTAAVLAIARVLLLLQFRRLVARHGLTMANAPRLERIFAAVYLMFALALGLFTAVALAKAPADAQIAVAALVVGYGAGVAANVALRPWIAVPAMLLSVLPAIASIALDDNAHILLGFVLLTLMGGGIASIVVRYRDAVEMIEMRQRFAALARTDPLTGLANRLALEDAFLRAVEVCGGQEVVLHCFDLDRFKPVNDTYGHHVGDLLLQAVAQRLNRLLRHGDLAVRLGGDEFAVLQTAVRHSDEAQLMARRIARSLAEPYAIDGRKIAIGASVGSASGRDHGPDLARMLGDADRALYALKKSRDEGRALAS